MDALACAFSQLRIREDELSLAADNVGSSDMPPDVYEGGLGARRPPCFSPPGSKPKNFRLRHLRGLDSYLPSDLRPAGQCESHWLWRLLSGACPPLPQVPPGAGAGTLQTLFPESPTCPKPAFPALPESADSPGTSRQQNSLDSGDFTRTLPNKP
ncbi:uncharacterized protein C16orf90 homolog isoform X2 [Tachyglossus aculeatus]|uniref:uncharacterized protein C16orf90 homolog isoform X2 n=1 Tax=Tachyglossus aculeatus TaxID=9261 RepID=UPI0018F51569|nr:uncharacterized protein C16orf90 homolog isoform X2 [Tachyglossus aculeatus]